MPLPADNAFFGLAEEMTDEQRSLVNSILDYNVVFSNSESGSGKTTMTLASLYYLHQKGVIGKVYYIFAPVEEKELGYRPGTTEEKEADYLTPLKDALAELNQYPDKALDPKYGWVEAKSHTFLRGSNLKNVGIILDEAQNWTHAQLQKAITRVKDDCHIVVVGHDGQIDLPNPKNSGFVDCIEYFTMMEPERARNVNLTKNFRGWISKTADGLQAFKQAKANGTLEEFIAARQKAKLEEIGLLRDALAG